MRNFAVFLDTVEIMLDDQQYLPNKITVDEMLQIFLEFFPEASVEEDLEGQILFYTGRKATDEGYFE